MTQRGTHTWDLILKYHRCPKCGYIIENRDDFVNHNGAYTKDLKCPRCHNEFSLTKNLKPTFGPIWSGRWRIFG